MHCNQLWLAQGVEVILERKKNQGLEWSFFMSLNCDNYTRRQHGGGGEGEGEKNEKNQCWRYSLGGQ